MDLAERVKAQLIARVEQLGWTVSELPRRLGIPRSTVYSWIGPEPKLPRPKHRLLIKSHLGIELGDSDLESNQRSSARALAGSAEDSLQLSKISDEGKVDAIEFDAFGRIPIELEGDQLLTEIRSRRYGRFSVDQDGQGLFALRLPADLGEYKAGERLVISPHLSPLPLEHVCVRARGKRWLGEYNVSDDGKPVVTLWGSGGGVTGNFDLVGTVIERTSSALKHPR